MYKTHHTFKLEVYEKLFYFDDFELKSGLNELHFFKYWLYEMDMKQLRWGNWKARPKSESVSDENLKKQPKLSEKERHNPKKKKSKEDKLKKNEPEYQFVDTEAINSGF